MRSLPRRSPSCLSKGSVFALTAAVAATRESFAGTQIHSVSVDRSQTGDSEEAMSSRQTDAEKSRRGSAIASSAINQTETDCQFWF